MPYFISNDNPECRGWAVEKQDREVMGCHRTRQEAIDQMVALSIAEGIEPGGERPKNATGGKELTDADFIPPQGARDEARLGLKWRREYGRGGTAVGVARARDISNGKQLSIETITRMVSYFARHEVDKQGNGWDPSDDGYPSAGLIAWKLWGGDPGRTWAEKVRRQWLAEQSEKSTAAGTNQGRITMNVKQKNSSATFQVKAATDEAPHGEVTAVVSVFGNRDLMGDIVMPGAFTNSLKEYQENGKSIPFVWSHQWDDPSAYVGKVIDAKETEEGLEVRAALFDTPHAQHIRTLLSSGIVGEFSFAYDIVKQAPGKNGNELHELRLIEVGPTIRGANSETRLVGVRSLTAARKAEPGELEPGDFVEWADGYGRVEYIMTEGFFGVDNDPLSLAATAEDPLALVREYEESEGGYEPTEMFTGHRFSELTKVDEKPAAPAEEEPAADDDTEAAQVETANAGGTGEKAGRTLSAKNETRIKDAVDLLSEVLASIGDEGSKSKEPNRVKDEEKAGMDPQTAIIMLELESHFE